MFKRTLLPTNFASPEDIEAGALLILRVGAREYGIDIRHVAEIRDLETPSCDGTASQAVVDLLPLNGRRIPFVDLRKVFADGGPHSGRRTAVVLKYDGINFGVVVDAVCAIEEAQQFSQSLSRASILDIESMLAWLPDRPRT